MYEYVCVHVCVCVGQLWHKETCNALDKKGRRTKNLNTSKTKCNYNKDFSTAAKGNEAWLEEGKNNAIVVLPENATMLHVNVYICMYVRMCGRQWKWRLATKKRRCFSLPATSSALHLSFIAYIKGPRCGTEQLTRTHAYIHRTITHSKLHLWECVCVRADVCACVCVSILLMDIVVL